MALIGKTYKQIQAESEKDYQKLKKRAENSDCMKFTMTIPKHLHLQFKTKLLRDRRNMKEFFIEMMNNYIEKD
jgi:hypothetical protein